LKSEVNSIPVTGAKASIVLFERQYSEGKAILIGEPTGISAVKSMIVTIIRPCAPIVLGVIVIIPFYACMMAIVKMIQIIIF